MKYIYVFILILSMCFIFTMSGCKEVKGHKNITIINNSKEVVYVAERWQGVINPSDTSLICGMAYGKVNAGDTVLLTPMNPVWEKDFDVIPFLQVFVLSEHFFSNGNCTADTLQKFQQQYQLKRYRVTLEDLERMNWTITYP